MSSSKRKELEAEIERLQSELQAMTCHVYLQNHLLNGLSCERDNDGHNWHHAIAHYNSLTAQYEIAFRWRVREIENDGNLIITKSK
jgi:hypothetical protein